MRGCVCSGLHACLHMCLHAWVNALTYVWRVAPWQISMQSTDCLHLCQFHLGNWLTAIHSVPVTTTFLFAGRWRSTTGESISGNSYHSQHENMSGLNYAFSNQNRQRKCSVFVSFRLSLCHSTLCVYTDVEINTCSFQKGCPPPLGLCLLAQSLWRESNVLDNWQLTMLPLSELCEFNPHWARDNLAASLWVIGHFPQPGKNNTNIYVCMRACVYVFMHIRMPACLSPCTCEWPHACVFCGIVQYLRWGE